ncbi:ATP-binding protein [Engelhardtia mirabilis]|uniref:histidine kinase n=1 Tax=Engelhardtia mirabilis TaxID=2528011 RepID=A0A518BPT6_9BACT|nr:Blue-light-activated protein [Planctomycetes bacterium Pla133]QDV03303.1 Blue-light-activated protein [Planctomycetes bacterium Pla86]
MNLASRCAGAFVAIAVLSAVTTGFLSYSGVQRVVDPLELDRLRSSTERLGAGLDRYVLGVRASVQALLADPTLRDVADAAASGAVGGSAPALDRLAARFAAELEAHPQYLQARLIAADADGLEIVRVDRERSGAPVARVGEAQLQRKGHRPYVSAAGSLARGEFYVSPIDLNREHGEIDERNIPVLRVSGPVFGRGGAPIGIVVINVDVGPALDALREVEDGQRTFLVNGDGDYLVHPDREFEFGFDRGRPLRLSESMPEIAAMLHGTGSVAAPLEVAGESMGIGLSPVRLADGPVVWVVRVLDGQVLGRPAASVRASTAWAMSIAVALALLVGLWLARSLTKPLQCLSTAVADLEPGQVIEVPQVTSGEIGLLARRFEDLSRNLAESLEEHDRLQRQVAQSNKLAAIGRLAGGVAHDFNNLLTVVIGFSEDARDQLPDAHPARASLELVVQAAESAATLTHQLLAFSRKQVLRMEVLDINAIVERTLPMIERLIGEDVRIIVALHTDIGSVRADAGQVEQVLINLAANARDAMPRGGQLTIETGAVVLDQDYADNHVEATVGPHVMLAVSDTGNGMEEAQIERIFEPFYTTKGVGKGTGLGLASVHGVIKQCGGNIWVYSEPGVGTTFKLYLPVAADEGPSSASEPKAALPRSRRKGERTILVVEDFDTLRELFVQGLRAVGYQVLEARDAASALEVSRNHSGTIDMLLTDVVLTGDSGLVLSQELQVERPDLFVVFMSGYTDNVIVHHGVLKPGLNFVEKPISPAKLALRVQEFLGDAAPAQAD